jgi:hypothetical protein
MGGDGMGGDGMGRTNESGHALRWEVTVHLEHKREAVGATVLRPVASVRLGVGSGLQLLLAVAVSEGARGAVRAVLARAPVPLVVVLLGLGRLDDLEGELGLEAFKDGERPVEPCRAAQPDPLAQRREVERARGDLRIADEIEEGLQVARGARRPFGVLKRDLLLVACPVGVEGAVVDRIADGLDTLVARRDELRRLLRVAESERVHDLRAVALRAPREL